MSRGMPVTVQCELVGLHEILVKYSHLGPKLVEVTSRTLYREGEKLMTVVKRDFVPVVTGTLRASGRVHPPLVVNGLVCEQVMGFGGPAAKYAYRVHENPRAGKTKGKSPDGKRKYKRWSRVGQWKYLEVPAAAVAPKVVKAIADGLVKAAGKGA